MAGLFGNITPPFNYTGYNEIGNTSQGLAEFGSAIIMLITSISGLIVLFNFISAGYLYLSSPGEPAKLVEAGNKMLYSLIGLAVISAAFILAGILGWLFFKDAGFLINPVFQNLI
ncbi:MAG: hypothetical protein AAB580_01785 [Patescibacteria group bacterium]